MELAVFLAPEIEERRHALAARTRRRGHHHSIACADGQIHTAAEVGERHGGHVAAFLGTLPIAVLISR